METETSNALTRDHINALRTADTLAFDYHKGKSGVRATKRGPAPWYLEVQVDVPATGECRCYGDELDYDVKQGKNATCCHVNCSSRYDREWQTIAELLRAGDKIHIEFVGGDDNGYLRRSMVVDGDSECGHAGLNQRLHHDVMYLSVRRGGKERYRFLVTSSVCVDNTARMVKPFGS